MTALKNALFTALSTMRDRDASRVFLGNLPHDVRERDIERFFDRFGRVRNIFIKNGKYGFCVSWIKVS